MEEAKKVMKNSDRTQGKTRADVQALNRNSQSMCVSPYHRERGQKQHSARYVIRPAYLIIQPGVYSAFT